MGRAAVLYVAVWFASFALLQAIQLIVLVAPAEMQAALTKTWAVAATVMAFPLTALLFRPASIGEGK